MVQVPRRPAVARSSASATPTPARRPTTTVTSTWTTTATSPSASTTTGPTRPRRRRPQRRQVAPGRRDAGSRRDDAVHRRQARRAPTAMSPSGQPYTGYWRVGGDNLNGWPNQPSSTPRRHDRRRGDLPDRADRRCRCTSTTSTAAARSTIPTRRPTPTARPSSTSITGPVLAPRRGRGLDGSRHVRTTAQASTGWTTLESAGGDRGTPAPAVDFDGDGGGSPRGHGQQPDGLLRGAVVQDHDDQRWQAHRLRRPTRTAVSGNYDRHVYMEDNGQLVFGVWTGPDEHDHRPGRLQRRQVAPRGRHPGARTA